MSRFQRVSHTKRTLGLLLAGASTFCLNSQTLKLAVQGAAKICSSGFNTKHLSLPCFWVSLLVGRQRPVEILHTGTSA